MAESNWTRAISADREKEGADTAPRKSRCLRSFEGVVARFTQGYPLCGGKTDVDY